ncbi:Os09g0261700 [Oryza sativa Japonica Group]|uniref:Os09g0261700 protein n=1 Tax=Oryza sativa subsp. japonica TaxID=39947 RepID=A0A0P0XKE3_ORYSJ|nr:Os09g0261700 [Oryza sativa Japonica Group]
MSACPLFSFLVLFLPMLPRRCCLAPDCRVHGARQGSRRHLGPRRWPEPVDSVAALRATCRARPSARPRAAAHQGGPEYLGLPRSPRPIWARAVQLALVHAWDGRFDQALADVARLVADRPGDPDPRITGAELCFLHGRNGTATEWLNSLPKDADGWRLAFEVVFAMPGSSPPSTGWS